MLFDFVSILVCSLIGVFAVYWIDEHVREKEWRKEKADWTLLMYDAEDEIRELSGGDTELTREIRDILGMPREHMRQNGFRPKHEKPEWDGEKVKSNGNIAQNR